MLKTVEIVRIGTLELPRYGDLTVGEDIALAQLDIDLANRIQGGGISQKEYDYRRAITFAVKRAGYVGEDLFNVLSRSEAQQLHQFLQEELAGIPPSEDTQPVPLGELSGSTGGSGSGSPTGFPANSQESVLSASD